MIGSFTKNTLITFFVRILTVILGFGISVIIARTLGANGQGIYSLAILLPSLLMVFTGFGAESATVFYIGKKKYPLNQIFGGSIIFSVLISLLAGLVGLFVVFFFGQRLFPGIERWYLLLGLSLIPFAVFFSFTVQILLGLQKIKKYNLMHFLQSFLFLSLIALSLLIFNCGISFTIISQVLSFILAGIILFFFVKKEVGGLTFKINKDYFRNFFSYGFKAYLSGIFGFLHHKIDLFLLNIFINSVAAGLYFVSVKLAEGTWHLSQSAVTALFPRVASENDQQQLKDFTPLVCRNILFISFMAAVLFFILGERLIVLFYTENFINSVRPFQILLFGAVAMCALRILAADLMGRGRPGINAWIAGVSTALNVALNILWIQKWGIQGAALATTVSYSLAFFATIFVYNKVSGNKFRDVVFLKKSDFLLYKNFLNFKNLKRLWT